MKEASPLGRRANYTPKPIAWVYLDAGYTLRWRRGDPVASVFEGEQMHRHTDAGAHDTIAVPAAGWTDLAEARQVACRWLSQQRPGRLNRRPHHDR